MKGKISTKLGVSYLSHYPEIYSIVSICTVICHQLIERHFSACNAIDNKNSMMRYDTVIEKYWANQSVYFRLETMVEMGMGITDGKLLLYHGISEQIKEKTSLTRE